MVEELYTPEQLAQMHDSLWQCVLQFANLSAAQERNRIARDLHDSVGHALTALNFQLQTAIKLYKPDPNQAEEFLTEAQRLVKLATQEVRQSVKALRSDTLETQPLETLVQSLVDDLRSTTGVTPVVNLDLQISPPSHLVVPVYRLVQEALNNIRKYAQAKDVKIDICANANEIQLQICDDGRGFDPTSVAGGYGLKGMHERVAVLKGLFLVESSPGHGCQINIWLPTHISTPSLGMTGLPTRDTPKTNPSQIANLATHQQPQSDHQEDNNQKHVSAIAPCATPLESVSTQTSLPDLSMLLSEINLDFSHILNNSNHFQSVANQGEKINKLTEQFSHNPQNLPTNVKIGEWQSFDLQTRIEIIKQL